MPKAKLAKKNAGKRQQDVRATRRMHQRGSALRLIAAGLASLAIPMYCYFALSGIVGSLSMLSMTTIVPVLRFPKEWLFLSLNTLEAFCYSWYLLVFQALGLHFILAHATRGMPRAYLAALTAVSALLTWYFRGLNFEFGMLSILVWLFFLANALCCTLVALRECQSTTRKALFVSFLVWVTAWYQMLVLFARKLFSHIQTAPTEARWIFMFPALCTTAVVLLVVCVALHFRMTSNNVLCIVTFLVILINAIELFYHHLYLKVFLFVVGAIGAGQFVLLDRLLVASRVNAWCQSTQRFILSISYRQMIAFSLLFGVIFMPIIPAEKPSPCPEVEALIPLVSASYYDHDPVQFYVNNKANHTVVVFVGTSVRSHWLINTRVWGLSLVLKFGPYLLPRMPALLSLVERKTHVPATTEDWIQLLVAYDIPDAQALHDRITNVVLPHRFPVVLTGHSLGGGLAMEYAHYLRQTNFSLPVSVVAFNAPMRHLHEGTPAAKDWTTVALTWDIVSMLTGPKDITFTLPCPCKALYCLFSCHGMNMVEEAVRTACESETR